MILKDDSDPVSVDSSYNESDSSVWGLAVKSLPQTSNLVSGVSIK